MLAPSAKLRALVVPHEPLALAQPATGVAGASQGEIEAVEARARRWAWR